MSALASGRSNRSMRAAEASQFFVADQVHDWVSNRRLRGSSETITRSLRSVQRAQPLHLEVATLRVEIGALRGVLNQLGSRP